MNAVAGIRRTMTAKRLRELLDYDPVTGMFRWRAASKGTFAHALAGTINCYGYRQIGHHGKKYFASRLAWLWMTGSWPRNEIDHRDRNRSNDSWGNLRAATSAQNSANTGGHASSGFKGVKKHHRRYVARIGVAGQEHHLGSFATIEQAHAAYAEAAKKLFGEFACAESA